MPGLKGWEEEILGDEDGVNTFRRQKHLSAVRWILVCGSLLFCSLGGRERGGEKRERVSVSASGCGSIPCGLRNVLSWK